MKSKRYYLALVLFACLSTTIGTTAVCAENSSEKYLNLPSTEVFISNSSYVDLTVDQQTNAYPKDNPYNPETDLTFKENDFPQLYSTLGTWIQQDGKWWFQYAAGGYPANKWEFIDGKWYYFDASGWMKTGWIQLGSTWYYLNSDGSMAIGWVQYGGIWYYMRNDGAMVTGWARLGSYDYYFNDNGVLTTSPSDMASLYRLSDLC